MSGTVSGPAGQGPLAMADWLRSHGFMVELDQDSPGLLPTAPSWGPPARLDFWTWEIDAKDCHCRVRRHRDGRREFRLCPSHGWPFILQAEEILIAFQERDPIGPGER